jgi:hypothetical protein
MTSKTRANDTGLNLPAVKHLEARLSRPGGPRYRGVTLNVGISPVEVLNQSDAPVIKSRPGFAGHPD